MTNDVDRIRQSHSLAEVAIQYGIQLQKDGYEWVACCPFHAEGTPSFTIFTGKEGESRFHCFGCGQSGDVLDFVKEIKGVGLREAISILEGETSRPNIEPVRVQKHDIYAGIIPIETDVRIRAGERVRLYNPKRSGHEWEWGSFKPERVHPYVDAGGTLIGYVLRRTFEDGKKETPMVRRVRLPSGDECWSRFPFPNPRPLYGLGELRDGQVIIVEGEKCRDDMAKATGRCVLSWAGGTQGVKYSDWSPLAGRDVIVWPDRDDPGLAAANAICSILVGMNSRPRILALDKGM